MTRTRTCKKCKRPAKNHPGRMGPSCQAYLLDDQPSSPPEPLQTSNRFDIRRKKQADPQLVGAMGDILPDNVSGRGEGRGARKKTTIASQPASVVCESRERSPPESLVPPSAAPGRPGSTTVPEPFTLPPPQPTLRMRDPGPVSVQDPQPRSSDQPRHVLGPNGEDLCLVCPDKDGITTPSGGNNPIIDLGSAQPTHDNVLNQQNQYMPRSVLSDNLNAMPCASNTFNNDRNCSEYTVNESGQSQSANYANLGAKLSECAAWLNNPLNATSGIDMKQSIVECLDDVAAVLCKLSLGDKCMPSVMSSPRREVPRREVRQMYNALNPINRPRDAPVPLFSRERENGVGRVLSRERLHNDEVGVSAREPSRLIWSTNTTGNRSCAYEAIHPPMNEPTVKTGGKQRYAPGTIQHKINSQGVPAKTIEQALDGEFVELCDFLSPIGASSNINNPDLECYVDNENRVNYRAKKHSRKITNFDVWCQAWGVYEKLLVGAYGIEMHDVMSDYRAFIMECNRKYYWHAVATYDFRHRSSLCSRLTLSGRLDFSSPSQTLLVTILDATSVKSNALRCNRCRGYDHVVSNCPFPESQFKAQAQKSYQNPQVTSEICNNFNKERCQNDKCRRIHKCKQCRGPLPYAKCILSGACSSNGKVTNAQ